MARYVCGSRLVGGSGGGQCSCIRFLAQMGSDIYTTYGSIVAQFSAEGLRGRIRTAVVVSFSRFAVSVSLPGRPCSLLTVPIDKSY